MTNLDDRLKAVTKVDISETTVINAKEQILAKAKKKRFDLAPIVVTGLMFALMCLIIFMPTSKTTNRAASLLTDDIKEIQFINNDRPNINHNVYSFNYFLVKDILDQQQQLDDFKEVLREAQKNVQPWKDKISGYFIYDFAVVMESGEVYQLKYNAYDEREDATVIYDVKNKLKYIAEHNDQTSEFNSHLYEGKSTFNLNGWVIFAWLIGVGLILNIMSYYYRKKYANLDERGKRKKLKGKAHYIPYFLFIVPLCFMWIIVGTFHFGLFLILLFLHQLITSQLEIKLGVMRPNNIHFKFLLPFYTICVIIAFVLILVV